jgi:hypothetical protein
LLRLFLMSVPDAHMTGRRGPAAGSGDGRP